jgi:signal transduction histidine kinase
MIVAVEGEIYQILVNLIVNAVQSISEKKGEEEGVIHIITSKEGKMVRLRVTDSGMGIPPEIQSRIFDMFFTTKTSGQGTGQGLAITQAIVYRHGGKISVHSNMGQGATFDILLPALDEQ